MEPDGEYEPDPETLSYGKNHTGMIMTTDTEDMLRAVRVNDRGQLVIPEEMRTALGIEGGSVLVLVKRGGEIVLRREEDVLEELEASWRTITARALERAWGPEDEVWEEFYQEAPA